MVMQLGGSLGRSWQREDGSPGRASSLMQMLAAQQARPAAAAVPAAAAPAVQQPGPVGAPVDPYAAIRTLGGFEPLIAYGPSDDSTGEQVGWQLDFDTRRALGNTPFRSKYSNVVALPDGRMQVTLQQPGAHKYDTMEAIYAQDPATGQWALQNDPMQARSRQVSTGESFVRDPLEQFGKDFILPAAAMYFGATALAGAGGASAGAAPAGGVAGGGATGGVSGSGLSLSGATSNAGIGAGTTTGFGGTGAGLSIPASVPGTATSLGTTGLGFGGTTGLGLSAGTSGGTSTLPSTLPEAGAQVPNLPTGAVEPVTMPSLPSSPTINPGPSGLPLEAALGTLPEVAQQQSDIPATDTPSPVTPPTVPGSTPGPGPAPRGSMPSWMPDWVRDNPQAARTLFTVLGGALGGAEGGSGGSGGGTPPTYGPPQAWSSGLTMGGGQRVGRPQPRQPVIDYTLPNTGGLSMGAGRFLGRGG
jgi:hypothetical protein